MEEEIDSEVIVQTVEGSLAGQIKISVRAGFKYFSFQGIPYAKPPIGQLRFKPPEPFEPWTEVRAAKKPGPACPSWGAYVDANAEPVSEDCLFLNVYTPQLPKDVMTPIPVMFWIHGGGFTNGSGSDFMYGPDFLITEGIVLVTINYRVGPFGFLSLGNSLCRGNMGLKDLLLGLKWVQRNIGSFGGDPGNVTIFGESAGGTAVDFMMVSPVARGLFHKAIAQSGVSIAAWPVIEEPQLNAYRLAELIGTNPEDDDTLMGILMEASEKDLCPPGPLFIDSVDPAEAFLDTLPFLPVIEENLPGAFLTELPRTIYERGDIPEIPYMLGTVDLEGLLLVADLSRPGRLNMNIDYNILICRALDLPLDTRIRLPAIQKIRNYAFPRGPNEYKYIDLYSFVHFEKHVFEAVELLRTNTDRKAPTFLYKFIHNGLRNVGKVMAQQTRFLGAMHGDELGYLFTSTAFDMPFRDDPGNEDFQAVAVITKAWTDFAKTGDPWPEQDRKTERFNYIEIDKELSLEEDFVGEKREFWEEVRTLV